MPYYILKYKEDSADYLEKIKLPEIHQNYTKGWGLREDDYIDHNVQNLRPRQEEDNSKEVWESLEAKHEKMMADLIPWNQAVDGSIEQVFWKNIFCP
jgi:hypothetical protein